MQPILEDEPTIDGAGIAKRKLLIPVDDSPESEKALAWAMREIYRYAASLADLAACPCSI